MVTLTRADLARRVADETGLPIGKAQRAVNALAATMGSSGLLDLPDLRILTFARRRGSTRSAVLVRFVNLAMKLLDSVPERALRNAAAASTDLQSVVAALETPEALALAPKEDQALEAARIRGLEARQQLLAAEGGTWTAEEAARHLRLTRQAVDKRRKTGRLIGLTTGRRGYLYPRWQFVERGTLRGLEDVLDSLRGHDPWTKMIFMLSPNHRLGGKTALQALRAGRIDEVSEVGAAFGEQGAA